MNLAEKLDRLSLRTPSVCFEIRNVVVALACALLTWFGIQNRVEAQISFPRPSSVHSIKLDGGKIDHWTSGQYEVLHLQGMVRVKQNQLEATSDEAIVFVEIPNERPQEISGVGNSELGLRRPEHKVLVYLEGNVTIDLDGQQANRIVDDKWFGRLFTSGVVDLEKPSDSMVGPEPAIFARAQSAMRGENASSSSQASFQTTTNEPPDRIAWVGNQVPTTDQTQLLINPQTGQIQSVAPALEMPPRLPNLSQPSLDEMSPASPLPMPSPQTGGAWGSVGSPATASPSTRRGQRITFEKRGGGGSIPLVGFVNELNPNERVNTFSGGIRITVEDPSIANLPMFQDDVDRQVVILADSMVYWQLSLPGGAERNQFYIEGDIVFAKGSRVIYAERMFYDVETKKGTILKAEVLTTVKDFEGAVRMKADVIQQLDENNLQAFGTAVTTSRLGVPRYWLQSEAIGIQQVPGQSSDSLVYDPTTGVASQFPSGGLDPSLVGNSSSDDNYYLDSRTNRVYLGGVPVFAWPRLQTNLNDPTLYLERLGINNDRIFGTQVTTGWNMYQLLGAFRGRPLDEATIRGTRWIGELDYLSDRGLGFGSEVEYDRMGLFGVPGRARGQYDSWFINDSGLDFLGRDRRDLIPEEEFRGRTVLKHRHDFSPGYQLRAELGYISDRNFLEQYFEREWDTQKDATTGFWLERNSGTNSFNLTGDLQLNEFFTQTSGLKFDWFKLGQPILNNQAIWHSRTQAGYVRMRQAEAPTNAVDAAKFDPLAWEADVEGMKFGTRQEIDFPMQFGPVKVVPYVLGDASFWQEARDGNDLFRAYGQTGVRASLPMWRVDPSIQSVLWNVNGLAHKVTFDIDAFFADASQDLDELALYEPLDDDSQEHFRRRFAFDTFGIIPGGDIPLRFDERNYAFRSGMQGNVTSPSEIADDLTAIKFGVRQRWQTKRGLIGREHIIDWITFDAQATLFPNANRDNFGADLGMIDYNFKWHVGDRVSLVSDGYFDLFSQGLRTASFGANISRPEIGNAYIGYRMIEGPISSNILSAALTYRMSDKWGVKAGGQVDFGQTGSIGQTLSLVYIGESFLWQFGFNYDYSRENFGFRFGFEPRFNRRPRLFRPGGSAIPPASSRWLE